MTGCNGGLVHHRPTVNLWTQWATVVLVLCVLQWCHALIIICATQVQQNRLPSKLPSEKNHRMATKLGHNPTENRRGTFPFTHRSSTSIGAPGFSEYTTRNFM
ncbi:hypothetical protein EDB89DRAFT_1959503 [Lactarius sanguifluus]|nr:hypothetical protein EDB89DRAFT_1959503 [Lactarius sanguifluus]